MRYAIYHSNARTRGSIGIFYPVRWECEAADAYEAEARFADMYESGGGRLLIQEAPDQVPDAD